MKTQSNYRVIISRKVNKLLFRTVRKQVTRTVCDRQIPRQKQFKIP